MKQVAFGRVAVTGVGCITALGANARATWDALCAGKSGRAPVAAISLEGCRVSEGAQADLPDLPGCSVKRLSRYSRASRLAIPAVREALLQAKLLDAEGRCVLEQFEMSVGTTAGGMEKGEEFLKGVWAGDSCGQMARVARYQAQQQTGEIQRYFGFDGPSMIVANACASGANAVGHAGDLIKTGCAEIVLAGAYEALCEMVFVGFDSLQALAPDKCRPFDLNRNGLMLGEGAAFFVMESENHARRRNADILGFLAGYGFATDSGHLTQPAQDGAPLERAVRTALADANMEPADIGYLNAHGTGTPLNDGAEAEALIRIFGKELKISSTKAALGHALGAAGAIEAALCLMALQSGRIPPQINTETPEPIIADSLATVGERLPANAVASVNLGFGGSNAALIFTRL